MSGCSPAWIGTRFTGGGDRPRDCPDVASPGGNPRAGPACRPSGPRPCHAPRPAAGAASTHDRSRRSPAPGSRTARPSAVGRRPPIALRRAVSVPSATVWGSVAGRFVPRSSGASAAVEDKAGEVSLGAGAAAPAGGVPASPCAGGSRGRVPSSSATVRSSVPHRPPRRGRTPSAPPRRSRRRRPPSWSSRWTRPRRPDRTGRRGRSGRFRGPPWRAAFPPAGCWTVQASLLSSAVSSATAPPLSSGLFRFPHFGDCTQDGHPSMHSQCAIASRVAVNHSRAAA